MIYPMVRELADHDAPVATACRVLGVSTSGHHDWGDRPASARRQADVQLVEIIIDIRARSRQTYGSLRIHVELRLGRDLRVGRTRVERLMREHSIVAAHGADEVAHGVIRPLIRRRTWSTASSSPTGLTTTNKPTPGPLTRLNPAPPRGRSTGGRSARPCGAAR